MSKEVNEINLHDILVRYVDKIIPGNAYKAEFTKRLEESIIKKIVDDNIEKIREEQNKIQLENEKIFKRKILLQKVDNAKEVAIVAIVIGFFVGLLVNQFTEIIAWGKLQMGEEAWKITCFCIIGILIVIVLLYKLWYTDKVSDIIKEGEDKNDK